jgi:hypothetical protein
MALQYSTALRDNQMNTIETTVSTTGTLEIRSGAVPANCAAADTGSALAIITLPADWLTASSSGTVTKSGTWADSSADNTGTAAYFRIKAGGGTVHMQGTVGTSASDMIVDNVSFNSGQAFSITTFSITAGNA